MADDCGRPGTHHEVRSFSLRYLLGGHDEPMVCLWHIASEYLDVARGAADYAFGSMRPTGYGLGRSGIRLTVYPFASSRPAAYHRFNASALAPTRFAGHAAINRAGKHR